MSGMVMAWTLSMTSLVGSSPYERNSSSNMSYHMDMESSSVPSQSKMAPEIFDMGPPSLAPRARRKCESVVFCNVKYTFLVMASRQGIAATFAREIG